MQTLVLKNGSLLDTHPELAAEWHPTKNKSFLPIQFTATSHQKVWWQCEDGHEWQAEIRSRAVGGYGCPACAGQAVIVGINDLLTLNPALAAEWHPTKNTPLTPSNIMPKSGKKVWWQCSEGHEWKATPNHRSKGSNCPYCSNKKVLVGYNDLETLNPILAAEWHPTKNGTLLPSQIAHSSGKEVWWRCFRGHEWRSSVNNRDHGNGCPECAKETQTSFPEQAIFFYFNKFSTTINRYQFDKRTEIDIYLPEFKFGIEYDGYFHRNKAAHERDARKDDVLSAAGIFLIRAVEVERLDSLSDHENVIYCKYSAYNFEYLNELISKLIGRFNAICFQKAIVDVDVARDQWDIYAQYIENEKQNSLLAKNPELAAEWHPIKNGSLLPSQISYGSNRKVWWQCSEGHEWQAIIGNRSKGRGCPFCGNRKVLAGYNDLATLKPEVAEEWHPTKNGELKASDVSLQSNKKVWWLGKCGHEWEALISSRGIGRGCPICANQKILIGFNDLATTHPNLAAEWHPTKNGDLTPNKVTKGTQRKVWWQCSERHEWNMKISNRTYLKQNCPFCAGLYAVPGINDLETTHSELAAEWHPTKNGDLKASIVKVGSHRKVWWLGKCGHEWQAIVRDRARGASCPICARKKK